MAASLPEIDHKTTNKVFDAHAAVQLQEHRGAASRRSARPPRIFGNWKLVVELQPSFGEFAKHQFGGQNLDGRGWRDEIVGALLEQHRLRVGVDENRVRGAGLKALRPRAQGRKVKADSSDERK